MKVGRCCGLSYSSFVTGQLVHVHVHVDQVYTSQPVPNESLDILTMCKVLMANSVKSYLHVHCACMCATLFVFSCTCMFLHVVLAQVYSFTSATLCMTNSFI